MTISTRLPRRAALLLPWAVAACGGDAPSRPMPLYLVPPNGASAAASAKELTPTMPD